MISSKKGFNIFTIRSQNIQVGDTVIVYKSRDNLSAVVIEEGKTLSTRFGEFSHNDLIGLQFGSKCFSRTGNGFTYLLRPTPELWTLALPHRTQILYHPDIAFITSYLDIKPGSIVIEAGTGSGSFSHSVARTIGNNGKLFSFEFHEERYLKASLEFESHGLISSVGGPITLRHRNVIKDGFGELKDSENFNLADSVFLDLPAPWDALEDAKRVMNRSQISRVCCFSPCIEQVQKTYQTLKALGFSDIVMFETLLRTHEPISFSRVKIESAVKKLQNLEVKKEARKTRQRLDAERRKKISAEIKTDSNEFNDLKNSNSSSQDLESDLKSKDKNELNRLETEVKIQSNNTNSKSQDSNRDLNSDKRLESENFQPSSKRSTKDEGNIKKEETEEDRCTKDPSLKQAESEFSARLGGSSSKLIEDQSETVEVEKEQEKKRELSEDVKKENEEVSKRIKRDKTFDQPNDRNDLNGKSKIGVVKFNQLDDDDDDDDDDEGCFEEKIVSSCKPAGMSRGHTSFLTFATLLPELKSNN